MKRISRKKARASSKKRRPINVLASVLTTLSLYLGLSSIFASIREDYDKAGYFILAAIVCDMLDGTVARITKSISEFGKELDSLCDLVSFGVAPAVLIYHAYWYEEQLAGTAVGRTGSMMAIIFAICAALRLARFNVWQAGKRESFTGLPTPAAGGTVAAFVLFMNYFEWRVAFYVLGPLTISLAFLMVSNVHYPKDRAKRVFVLAPHSAFRMLALSVIVIGVFHYAVTHHPVIVVFPLCMAYVLFGVGDELTGYVKARRACAAAPASAQSSSSVPEVPGGGSGASATKTGERL